MAAYQCLRVSVNKKATKKKKHTTTTHQTVSCTGETSSWSTNESFLPSDATSALTVHCKEHQFAMGIGWIPQLGWEQILFQTQLCQVWGYCAWPSPGSSSSTHCCYHPHRVNWEKQKNPRRLKTACYRSLLTQVMLMERYGSRKAQGNLNQSYFMASSPTPYLIHFNRKCHSHPLTLMVSQFRNTIQPKSNKAKKQFITSLINSLTLLNSQPQRLLYQEGKMHSQEGGKTTMVPVQAAQFLDKLR